VETRQPNTLSPTFSTYSQSKCSITCHIEPTIEIANKNEAKQISAFEVYRERERSMLQGTDP
jgi:hypothetical protein